MRIFFVLIIVALQMTVAPEIILQMRGVNVVAQQGQTSLPASAQELNIRNAGVTVVYKG